jgi:hypothetical protein
VLTAEQVADRGELIRTAPDLAALLGSLDARITPLLARDPAPPEVKALLSSDGGICPEDRTPLLFDPWEPDRHRCPRCRRTFTGERHYRRWAWLEHLWLAERIAHAAAVGVFAGREEAAEWSAQSIARYGRVYFECPNQDNVLGPARLFFSTYLESIWLTQFLAGAFALREGGLLDGEALNAANEVVEEAANLIGDFDEGLSNRQTWNNTALVAAAVWFEDEDLARRGIEGHGGLIGHLADGFRPDGLWYEGDNYHLFALRGLLVGAGWARLAGVDLFETSAAQDRLAAALRAPGLTAFPDGTFPARKDSRYGISLAQPMYLEIWEAGAAELRQAGRDADADRIAGWLRWLYGLPAPEAIPFDSYLHEAGEPAPAHRGRRNLSWWMLYQMLPVLPEGGEWRPGGALLANQGLAVLRASDRYASLECGPWVGGHDHPDRLHLTLFAEGVPWLADPGTGSYVSRDLAWYRSTLAHNAPLLDGAGQEGGDARCEAFDQSGDTGWIVGRFGGFTRTVVLGGPLLLDQLEFASGEEHLVEQPWHFAGDWEITSPGRWEPVGFQAPFVEGAERFVDPASGPIHLRARQGDRVLSVLFDEGGEFLRARAPGPPGTIGEGPRSFLLRRRRGRYVRSLAVLAFDSGGRLELNDLKLDGGALIVETSEGRVVHRPVAEGWEVAANGGSVVLRGRRRSDARGGPVIQSPITAIDLRASPLIGEAPHLLQPPALDGSLAGFDTGAPLHLDHEDQYRRSETPYPGAEEFSATAWLNWDEDAFYLAVVVRHPDPVFRPADAPPLLLDNEPDDIHSDGLQIYLRLPGEPPVGLLVVPDRDHDLRARPVTNLAGELGIRGAWQPTSDGYGVTLALRPPGWSGLHGGAELGFDLLVNEMRAGRTRRAGQLVWSGGNGWVYLWGDRQQPQRLGTIVLG